MIRNMAVRQIRHLTPDVVQLLLETPDDPMEYIAGQYAALHLPDGDTRCYSMAQRCGMGALEFHIRLLPGGKFSGWLREALAQPQIHRALAVSGPYGECVWRRPLNCAPTLMLATGTGIAPLLALLDEAAATATVSPVVLYWGNRRASDFYLLDEIAHRARGLHDFRLVQVIEQPDTQWPGRAGYVQDCAALDFPDLQSGTVYACGAPAMVEQARRKLVAQCGLDAARFHADVFAASNAGIAVPAATERIAILLRLVDGTERALQLPAGTTLMQALREMRLIDGICGGNGACGSCRVTVEGAWLPQLPPASRKESRLLAVLEHSQPGDRLGCQIQLVPALDGLRLAIPHRPLQHEEPR